MSSGSADHAPPKALPFDRWRVEQEEAVEEILRLGLEIVRTHRSAGELAEKNALKWKLEERQEEEHKALGLLAETLSGIFGQLAAAREAYAGPVVQAAADAIVDHLPAIEEAFVAVRHGALDLLLWTRRSGYLEDSPLPGRYREAYARLMAHSPEVKPWTESLQADLLERTQSSEIGSEARALLSAVTRFDAVLETARGFLRAVSDPPLELVFHETNLFLDDWGPLSGEQRGPLASLFNDACEFLLYAPEEFARRVTALDQRLPGELDSSLFAMDAPGFRVLFSVDEDPLFGELVVTLFRVVPAADGDGALAELIDHLAQKVGGTID